MEGFSWDFLLTLADLFIGFLALRVLLEESSVKTHVAVEGRRVLEAALADVALDRTDAIRRTVARRVNTSASASASTSASAHSISGPFHFGRFLRLARHLHPNHQFHSIYVT